MFLLPERQTNDACVSSKQQCFFGNWGAKDVKVLQCIRLLGRALTQAASRRSVMLGGLVSIIGQST